MPQRETMNDLSIAEAQRRLTQIKLTLTGEEPFASNAAVSQIADTLNRHRAATVHFIIWADRALAR